MYLKNLTVLGFKSFADKTALNFQPGVTAIVGPNGCGKSNVSDAIRWVLGEQSAKALRGGEMADVIFNGTDGRKPLGMAEVSLTIGGVDQEHLSAAGVVVDYNEVTVTRRVFRDGGSEYFINKTACRLKDIQQLFMGTGVGRTSYSIMAQGNITQILSSKPEDRRMIFEEAAGITKYKAQKKEALRKLDYTEQNLLRVADLVREVKRQIGSLQRQAGKARRFKQISSDLQQLDTQLARHHFDVLQSEISTRLASAEELRNQIEANSAAVLQCEDEIVQLRTRQAALDHEIGSCQQRGLELKGESDRHESRANFNEERLRELAGQNATATADLSDGEDRRRTAAGELEAAGVRLAELAASVEAGRLAQGERAGALRAVDDELRAAQENLRQAQSGAFAAAQDLSRVRNELNSLDLQKQGNLVRLEKLAAEQIQLAEERTRLEQRLEEFSANVEAEKVEVQTQRGSVEERQQRLRQIQEDLNQAGRDLDPVVRAQAEKRSRLAVLEQLQAGHEGFSSGAQAALKASEHVLGTLADKIQVPDRFVTAIETALGHHLQLVLTAEPEAAREILAGLAAGNRGRASIAPLAFCRDGTDTAAPDAGATSVEEGPVPALAVVRGEEPVARLLQRLLGTTRIVIDLAAATTAWRETAGAFSYVTLGGELLSAHGVFTGGSTGAGGGSRGAGSILGRKNQIIELQAAVAQLQEQVAEISRRRASLQTEQVELQASLQQAQTELRAREVAVATRQGEFNALRNSHRLLLQKAETVAYEHDTLSAREEEGLRKRAALAARAGELEAREQDCQARVTEGSTRVDALRQQRETANAALTESRVALASGEQLRASVEQQSQSLARRVAELSRLIDARRAELGSFVTRREQAETEIQASRAEMERLRHERALVNTQVTELAGQKQALDRDVAGREESLREQRRGLGDTQQRRSAIEIELAQKQMAVQNLRERIQQKYHLNLDEVRSECITITIADEGPPKVQVLTPDEMAASGAATDWASVAEQAAALQQRIDEMGPVNLVAIEEYEETEERFQFLSRQLDDLTQAKVQLLEVINRINTQTRDMFRQTFEQIRDNFRAMFTEVFGGGKADLVLMDEEDLLESGIEIVARPPGKQLQTISLLSGGEQTMTAVSLLFSIYQVKPSPFCVLDELDAPLDESNINRFIKVLQRFLTHSQFIIITHNKRTIGMADVLYGVTMQEHGVSKIVSVKFHRTGDAPGEHAPVPLDSAGSRAPQPSGGSGQPPPDSDQVVLTR